jgi:hypothetical protein
MQKSIQLVDAFEHLFLKSKCVRGMMGPLAAGPASAEPLGVPTHGAIVWPRPAGQEANPAGSDNGDIMLGDIGGAAIASLRGDCGTGEHGRSQQSESGDLHGSGNRP